MFTLDCDKQIMQLSLVSLKAKWEKKLEPLIHSHDVNGEMFSHKPLKCFVMTQAETAVIELDEPSCELQLQYQRCQRVRVCCAQVCLIERT